MTPDERPRVVVVGGGITGLATAWFLRERAQVTVVEASDRLGGKIGTLDLAGIAVEAGPDTFLARVPHATDLCRAIGLGDDLIAPATGEAFIWTRDRLRPLPTGVLGVPTDPASLVASGILSVAGLARAAADLVLPRRAWDGDDPSVADVIRRRLGREVLDHLVEPLVGGINAGRADGLSLAATAPQLAKAACGHRSLILGARRERRGGSPAAGPVFLGISGGMQRLVDRLADRLGAAGVGIVTGTSVTGIDTETGDDAPRYSVRLTANPGNHLPPPLEADAVVLTVPPFAAAPLISSSCPSAAHDLTGIAYASVALVTYAYRHTAFSAVPTGAGFLVPRTEGRLMTACTFTSSKWPGTGAEQDLFIVRASAGRAGDERVASLDDDELTTRLHLELTAALGLRSAPTATLVTRWPRAFPQYEPGHQARVEGMEATLAEAMPGVLLAGAAYRGLGIAACIRQAQEAADRLLDAKPAGG